MKKGLLMTAASLMLLVGFACSNEGVENTQNKPQGKVAPKITVTENRSNEYTTADEEGGDLSSVEKKARTECLAIPQPPSECIPCGEKAKAVSAAEAKKVMAPYKQRCMDKFKDKAPECEQFKSAEWDAEANTCVLVDITKEELQERAKKYAPKEGQGQQGQGQQGGGYGAPQRGGRGGGSRDDMSNRDYSWQNPSALSGQLPPGFEQGAARGLTADPSRQAISQPYNISGLHGNSAYGRQSGYPNTSGNSFPGLGGNYAGAQGNPYGNRASSYPGLNNAFGTQSGYTGLNNNPFGSSRAGYPGAAGNSSLGSQGFPGFGNSPYGGQQSGYPGIGSNPFGGGQGNYPGYGTNSSFGSRQGFPGFGNSPYGGGQSSYPGLSNSQYGGRSNGYPGTSWQGQNNYGGAFGQQNQSWGLSGANQSPWGSPSAQPGWDKSGRRW